MIFPQVHGIIIYLYIINRVEESEARKRCAFQDYQGYAFLFILINRKIPVIQGKEFVEEKYCVVIRFHSSSSYSSIYNYNEEGIHWAYLSNVCLKLNSLEIQIYQEKRNSAFESRLEGYQHLWKFRKQYQPYPSKDSTDVAFWEEEGAWMIIPGWSRHTSHFSENIMMVNHHAVNPSLLPPV